MSDSYAINVTSSQGVKDEMVRATAAIRQRLDELEAECTSSLSEWTADAQQAYRSAKLQWDQAAQQMPAALQGASQKLDQIIVNYQTTDRNLTNSWSGYAV